MKIQYVDQHLIPLYETSTDIVPRIGEKVVINEEFYVTDVNHDPQNNSIFIILSEFKPKTNTILESSNKDTDVKMSSINKLLIESFKELKSIKSRLQNVEQTIKQSFNKK
jgi:hypothetical protein